MRKIIKILTAFVLIGAVGTNVYASDLGSLYEDRQEAESKKEEAQAAVDQLSTEKENILAVIAELDAQVEEYNAQILELENQKAVLNADIETTKEELTVAQAEEAEQYEAMKLRIKYSYENGNVEYLDTLFSTADLSDMVNKSEYVEQIYEYDSEMLSNLISIKKKIADYQLELESDLAAVEDIEAEVADNKAAVEIMIEGKQVQAKNYNESIEEYEAQVAAIQADIDATNEAIAAAEAVAAASGDTTVYYTGGTFQWPVGGNGGTVTSPYGPRWGRMHQGIDIGCPTGTPILAGEAGTVIASEYSSSMGYYVLIDHGDGVSTVYMHNSVLQVSVGQTVARGQQIALAGSTGNSTGPHCHFGVRINGTYVDPAPYLY